MNGGIVTRVNAVMPDREHHGHHKPLSRYSGVSTSRTWVIPFICWAFKLIP